MDAVKIVLTGDIATGKTCIIKRFVDDIFEDSTSPTIGECSKTTISIDGKEQAVELWDTAGQERFRTVTSSFYKGAKVVIFVFDITKKQTFTNLNHWLTEVDRCAAENAERILIGNKIDLQKREVSEEEAKEYATELGIEYYEVSAKTGKNVNIALESVIKEVLNKSEFSSSSLAVYTGSKKKTSKCNIL
mmetsp:Transcript_9856/g.16885  ORF Transcript_9856/g.16885 Transcript_9856/m.16885 type:complete len:190 (+) Transcript_9856:25-594(+)